MRGDQLARQWQLIQRLAKSRGGAHLDALAEELGCVRRTLYRDLDALMFAGFPVVSEKRDGRVYYRFLETFRLGDVPFTPDEILALAFGEDLLAPYSTTRSTRPWPRSARASAPSWPATSRASASRSGCCRARTRTTRTCARPSSC